MDTFYVVHSCKHRLYFSEEVTANRVASILKGQNLWYVQQETQEWHCHGIMEGKIIRRDPSTQAVLISDRSQLEKLATSTSLAMSRMSDKEILTALKEDPIKKNTVWNNTLVLFSTPAAHKYNTILHHMTEDYMLLKPLDLSVI